MSVWAPLSLLVPVVTGYVAASLLWPSRSHVTLRLCLGVGLGASISSLIQFLWRLTASNSGPGPIVIA